MIAHLKERGVCTVNLGQMVRTRLELAAPTPRISIWMTGLRPAEPDLEPWRACSRPLRLAYVTAQGTSLPCCIAPFTDAPFDSLRLGNYLDDGLAAVWHGPAYQRFREQLYSSEPPPSYRNSGLAWSL